MKGDKMITWKIEKRNIEDLRGYDKNPRKFTEKGLKDLKKSLQKCGDANIITINADNTVLGGHARLTVMKQLGYKEVDVKVPNRLLNEQEIKEVVIRLNANTAGEWDLDKLQANFELNDLEEWGLDIEFPELDEQEIKEVEVPENVETRCKAGDIWKLGEHRLMCGDSTKVEHIQKLMDGEKADLLITDPPYNVAYEGKTKDKLTIQNDSLDDANFREFLKDAFFAADSVMKPGAVFYIWHADSEGYNFRGACRDVEWKVRQCLIWNKNAQVMGRQDYHWKHEPCLYGWKEGASHLWASDRKQTTVLDFDRPNRNGEHPTMKPVALFDYQIKNNTKGSDIVLDSFGGSGTTLIACEQNKRIARIMELDPHYCDVIIQRWENLTGKQAELCQ